jgi:hypothetical protein
MRAISAAVSIVAAPEQPGDPRPGEYVQLGTLPVGPPAPDWTAVPPGHPSATNESAKASPDSPSPGCPAAPVGPGRPGGDRVH